MSVFEQVHNKILLKMIDETSDRRTWFSAVNKNQLLDNYNEINISVQQIFSQNMTE